MSISISEAYQHCENLAKSHYENFPVGALIPKKKRPYVWSIYAFARTADDLADENYPTRLQFSSREAWREQIQKEEASRLGKLESWNQELNAASQGKAQHPIFIALQKTIADLQIPVQLLQDLLTAFKMDVVKRRYANWDEVMHYCKHSADPVGRLVLRVFGYQDEKLDKMSDAICSGLQLANFWQDIAVDREKDRFYIPQEILNKYSLSIEDLFDAPEKVQAQAPELLKDLGNFTADLFRRGAHLPLQVKGKLRWELKCTWLGGVTILKRACFDPNRQGFERPKIRRSDKFLILLRSLFAYNGAIHGI